MINLSRVLVGGLGSLLAQTSIESAVATVRLWPRRREPGYFLLYSATISAIKRRMSQLRRRSDTRAIVSGNIIYRSTLSMKLASRKVLSVQVDERPRPRIRWHSLRGTSDFSCNHRSAASSRRPREHISPRSIPPADRKSRVPRISGNALTSMTASSRVQRDAAPRDHHRRLQRGNLV